MIDSFRGKYAFLSNMYPCNIEYNLLGYDSVESGYQSAKFDCKHRKAQFATLEGKQAKRYANSLKNEWRADWNDVKESVMMELLMIKFSIPELRKLLDETGDEELVEGNWWNDTFWGVCNGVGQNILGKLLMKVREYNRINAD